MQWDDRLTLFARSAVHTLGGPNVPWHVVLRATFAKETRRHGQSYASSRMGT
ncbi:MAG: hypothetical protein AAGF46_12630 [Pseudomonadota bacterium]